MAKRGEINLITGPMFSNKTTELMLTLKRYLISGKNVLMIKHSNDTRYSKNLASSHDGMCMIAVAVNSLQNVVVKEDVDIIGIDEGQFFEDLLKFCLKWIAMGKTIYIAALCSKAKRFSDDLDIEWPEIQKIIPFVSDISFQKSVCIICGSSSATRNKCLVSLPKDGVLIGGGSKFVSVCVSCEDVEVLPQHLENRGKCVEKIKELFI